ncbi:50S ribosomal protein L21 [Patescibacteria group bacterium]|nr:50S ribosomal protein L21 [Patescibacteria group bacterium]MBU1922575.1 50S ribosomal protein L21 [Patescibacteria group bacterium]
MLAVIKTGGKQYKVEKGDKIKIEKLPEKEGKAIKFDQVLLLADKDGKDLKVGEPFIKGAAVDAKILEHGKSKKVTVIKYKRKIRYRKEHGHRQQYTQVEITKI